MFGAAPGRQHAGCDPRRFVLEEPVAAGHAAFFGGELTDTAAVRLGAEAADGSALAGYALGRRAERMLLDVPVAALRAGGARVLLRIEDPANAAA